MKKQVVTNWKERTVEDAFNDVKNLANDLAMSLQNRIGLCTSNAEMENFFDIQETFEYLCDDRLNNDHINIQEVIVRCLVLHHSKYSFVKFAI